MSRSSRLDPIAFVGRRLPLWVGPLAQIACAAALAFAMAALTGCGSAPSPRTVPADARSERLATDAGTASVAAVALAAESQGLAEQAEALDASAHHAEDAALAADATADGALDPAAVERLRGRAQAQRETARQHREQAATLREQSRDRALQARVEASRAQVLAQLAAQARTEAQAQRDELEARAAAEAQRLATAAHAERWWWARAACIALASLATAGACVAPLALRLLAAGPGAILAPTMARWVGLILGTLAAILWLTAGLLAAGWALAWVVGALAATGLLMALAWGGWIWVQWLRERMATHHEALAHATTWWSATAQALGDRDPGARHSLDAHSVSSQSPAVGELLDAHLLPPKA